MKSNNNTSGTLIDCGIKIAEAKVAFIVLFLVIYKSEKSKTMFDKLFITCLTLLFMVVTVVFVEGQDQVQPGPPDYCIRSENHFFHHYHKDTPSPEGNDFRECTSWQNSSCCTHALADDFSSLATQQGVYSFSFAHCEPVSSKCARYLKVKLRVNLRSLSKYAWHDCLYPTYDVDQRYR